MFTAHGGLFLFNGGDDNVHTLALQRRHVLGASELLKLHSETQELLLALVLEHDGTAAEEDGGLHLGTLLQELLRMLELELEVVLVGIGAETDFLENDLCGIALHLLGLLLLLVQIFLVIEYLAYGRIGLVGNEYQVEFQRICKRKSLGKGIYPLLGNVFTHETHLRGSNLLVNRHLVLVALLGEARVGLAGLLEA